MPRYRLTYEHHVVIDGIDFLLPADTEVGDGTEYPWHYTDASGKRVDRPPSLQMVGVDPDGIAAVEARLARLMMSPEDKELIRPPVPFTPPPGASGAGTLRPREGDVPGSGLPVRARRGA